MSQQWSSLDDLILLNREIAALVKAGIPLELGLRGLSGSVGTRLGRLSERLSQRLASGETLPQALAEEGPAVSPVYTAVMEAGLASGRLSEALESLALSGQAMQETRRRVYLSLMYPVLCCLIGYGMFCLFLTVIAPQMIHAAEMFRFPTSWPIEMLKFLHRYRLYAILVVPTLVLALVVVGAFFRSRFTQALLGVSGAVSNVMSRIPGGRRLMTWFDFINPFAFRRSLNWAQFTELLALQIEQKSALPRALILAAESTSDIQWQREATIITEKLNRGDSFSNALKSAKGIPLIVSWMLSTGEKQGTLVLALRQMSTMYRRRALLQAQMLKTWVPMVITICVTGGIGLVYGLLFFIPMRALLTGLMHE